MSCVGGVYLSGSGSMSNPYTDQVVVGEDTNLGRLAVSNDGTFTYTAKADLYESHLADVEKTVTEFEFK